MYIMLMLIFCMNLLYMLTVQIYKFVISQYFKGLKSTVEITFLFKHASCDISAHYSKPFSPIITKFH